MAPKAKSNPSAGDSCVQICEKIFKAADDVINRNRKTITKAQKARDGAAAAVAKLPSHFGNRDNRWYWCVRSEKSMKGEDGDIAMRIPKKGAAGGITKRSWDDPYLVSIQNLSDAALDPRDLTRKKNMLKMCADEYEKVNWAFNKSYGQPYSFKLVVDDPATQKVYGKCGHRCARSRNSDCQYMKCTVSDESFDRDERHRKKLVADSTRQVQLEAPFETPCACCVQTTSIKNEAKGATLSSNDLKNECNMEFSKKGEKSLPVAAIKESTSKPTKNTKTEAEPDKDPENTDGNRKAAASVILSYCCAVAAIYMVYVSKR